MNKNIVICPTYSPNAGHEVKNLGIINKVRMSCGGGMGGSTWYEYGKFKSTPKIGELVEFVDAVSGETKSINPSFIVKVEQVQLVKVTTDVTPHANYAVKSCDKATHTTYYWFDKTDSISGIREHHTFGVMDSNKLKDNIIYSEYVKE